MSIHPDLQERIVLVTGGANGIGQTTVEAFQQQGARVFFCDVDTPRGRALARQLGPQVSFKQVDLRKAAQIKGWIAPIIAKHKQIHVLVNNAATDPRISLADLTPARWDDLMARNLRSQYLTCRQAAPAMPPGSSIINLSSITFHTAPANMSAYVASKAGIIGLTRSLARELGPDRIRVNTVSPGWIMTARQLQEFVTPAVKRQIKQSQCIPELIQPAEIAAVILFLASQASSAITGQELLADRGWAHS